MTSESGKKFITAHEANVLRVYLDPVGLPTVGIGHLLTPEERKVWKVGDRITLAESLQLFERDLATREVFLNSVIKVPVNQNQFDALMALMFNIGNGAFQKSTCLRKLNAKDYAGAADAMLAWNKATRFGKRIILPGLVRRRKEERALFLKPAKIKPLANLPENTADTAGISDASAASTTPSETTITDQPKDENAALKEISDKYLKHCKTDSFKNAALVVCGRIGGGVSALWLSGISGKILTALVIVAVIAPVIYALIRYRPRIVGWGKTIFSSLTSQ